MDKRILFIILALLIVGLFVGLLIYAVMQMNLEYSKTEVDSYIEVFEISQLAYSEEQFSETTSSPVYRAGIRNENTAVTIRISSEDFARYTVGEIVTVKVTVYGYSDGSQGKEYTILGLSQTEELK